MDMNESNLDYQVLLIVTNVAWDGAQPTFILEYIRSSAFLARTSWF
jgi:hypothetical protein